MQAQLGKLHKLFQKEYITDKPGGSITNSRSILVLIFLAFVLTVPTLGQQNATQPNETRWFNVGLNLYSQDRYNESLQAYNNVIEINQRNEAAWNNKGIDLSLLGRYDEALVAFDRATSINSSYAEAWYNMGVAYDLKGDLNSAIQAYNKATEINPNYEKAWINKNQDMDVMGIGHTSLYNELTHVPSYQ
jgi:tetratricopeptide (TPR) repeat protein